MLKIGDKTLKFQVKYREILFSTCFPHIFSPISDSAPLGKKYGPGKGGVKEMIFGENIYPCFFVKRTRLLIISLRSSSDFPAGFYHKLLVFDEFVKIILFLLCNPFAYLPSVNV